MSATESKFKVGDIVKRAHGWAPGRLMRVTEVISDDDFTVEWLDGGRGSTHHWHAYELELAQPSPIRTVTRREIVPGAYGDVTVERIPFEGLEISYKSYGNAHKLREAAHIFNQIAEALEENAKEAA